MLQGWLSPFLAPGSASNFFKKYLSKSEQSVGGNMDDKSHFDEVSDRNEEHAIGN